MALSNLDLLSEEAYYALLYDMLKLRENPWLYYGTGYQRIHNGGGDGNPTFGYGFNLAAFSTNVVRDAILYAYDNNLSAEQANGLDLVLAWKSGASVTIDGGARTLTNADVINLANASLNGGASAIGSASQRAAVQSLFLNDAQATRLLDVVVKGALGLVQVEGSGYGFEAGLDYRLAEEGVLPYSVERAALLSVYYNAPSLIGPGVQNEVAEDDRPTLWYEIRYNHNHYDHTGLQNRRAEEADLLGLVSRAARDNPDAHLDEYLGALDTLFNGADRLDRRLYSRMLERDAKDPFTDAIAPELGVLQQFMAAAPMAGLPAPMIEFVQRDPYDISGVIDASDASAAGVSGGKTYVDTVNLIAAGAGDDEVRGFGGADYLYGGDGADTLVGDAGLPGYMAGGDLLHGGAGYDTADYSGETGAAGLSGAYVGVLVDGAATIDLADRGGAIDRLVSIERLVLSTGGDTLDLRGAAAGFRVAGLAGDDWLAGGDGDDVLVAGSGDDSVFSGFGDDRLEGDDGRDFMRSGPGSDTLIGGDGGDTLGASNRSDLIRAGGGDDLALGSNGNDRLFGDAGDDTLLGGNGRDSIEGGDGADRIVAGGGNDRIRGGAGDDTMIGGANNDRFILTNTDGGADMILDFAAGDGAEDVILLLGFGAALDSFTEVLAVAAQAGADTIIDLGGAGSLRLAGVDMNALSPDDFIFG